MMETTEKRKPVKPQPRLSSLRQSAAIVAVVTLTGLAWLALSPAPGVMAHAGYETSTPGDGETVAEGPEQVDIYFSQEMARSGGLPRVIVVNQAGDQLDLGSTLDDDDRTHVSVDLPPALPEGRYTVIWQSLSSEDGEEAEGAFHFFIGQATEPTATGEAPSDGATAAPTAQPTAAPSTDDGDNGGVSAIVLVLGILAGLVIGGAAGTAFASRRAG